MNTRIALIVGTVLVAGMSQGNMLTNGSFEVNSFVGGNGGADDTADNWRKFTDLSPLSSPDVWDNAGVGGLAPGSGGHFPHISAYQGTKFSTIASFSTSFPGFSEGIESSQVSLLAGQTYRVSLNIAYDAHSINPWKNPFPVTVRLRQASNPSTVLTNMAANSVSDTWEYRSYDFTVGASDNYTVIFSSESNITSNYLAIDDAALVAVPEPSSLLAIGLGSLAVMRRKRLSR